MFSFVNSYASSFYIAFIAQYQSIIAVSTDDQAYAGNPCGINGCMALLSSNLIIVTLSSLTVDKLSEFYPVMLIGAKKVFKCFGGGDAGKTQSRSIDEIQARAIEESELEIYNFDQRLDDFTTLFTTVSFNM